MERFLPKRTYSAGHNVIEGFDKFLNDIGIHMRFDRIAQHLARHPFLAISSSAAIISIALPFLIFLVFAGVIVMMTFTGFIIIEGTLITIASIFLFGFLGAVTLVFLFFVVILLSGYCGFIQIYDIIKPPVKDNGTGKSLTQMDTIRNGINH